jgi:hypothetical protein
MESQEPNGGCFMSRTVLVRVSFVIPVEFSSNYTDEDIRMEIEQGCPGTKTVGAAFDLHCETQEAASMCWACTLRDAMQKIVTGEDPVLENIARIRHRPAKYIGSHSAEAMFLYLAGYREALQDHTGIVAAQYQRFILSLYLKYQPGGGGNSWAWLLREKAGSDSAALDLFYDELDAFLERKA